jgi:hypothetical protein
MSGENKKYPDFYTETGYGKITGLCGINCRHSFHPFDLEIDTQIYSEEELNKFAEKTVKYKDKELKVYEATQYQRYLERQVRKHKREKVALETTDMDTYKVGIKLREYQRELVQFTQETGLRREYFREQIA